MGKRHEQTSQQSKHKYKHAKIPTASVIKKMQTRTTITHYLTPTRLAEIREADATQHCGQSPHVAGGVRWPTPIWPRWAVHVLVTQRACSSTVTQKKPSPPSAHSRGVVTQTVTTFTLCHVGPVRCVDQSRAQAHGGSWKWGWIKKAASPGEGRRVWLDFYGDKKQAQLDNHTEQLGGSRWAGEGLSCPWVAEGAGGNPLYPHTLYH